MVAKNQRGQALIEFIIFLPFMLMMYMVVVNLGDAIHGSINQQKVTRSYFYFRLQGNSQISKPQRNGSDLVNDDWSSFGHGFIGWADYIEGGSSQGDPVLSCWRLNLPFAPAAGDSCEDSYDDVTTQFIRVATAYGICGATFAKENDYYVELPSTENTTPAIEASSCWIID
jgi:hypothetical protein